MNRKTGSPRKICGEIKRGGAKCMDPQNGASGLCTNHAAKKWNDLIKGGWCDTCQETLGLQPHAHPKEMAMKKKTDTKPSSTTPVIWRCAACNWLGIPRSDPHVCIECGSEDIFPRDDGMWDDAKERDAEAGRHKTWWL